MLEQLKERAIAGDESAKEDIANLMQIFRQVSKEVETTVEFMTAENAALASQIIGEEAWLQVRSQKEFPAIACRKGCSHCCYLHVKLTEVEVVAIANYLRRMYSNEVVAEIVQRAKKAAEAIGQCNSLEDRVKAKIPCSLLHEVSGTCMAYQVRPNGCRGFNSLDAQACEDALKNPPGEVPNLAYKVVVFDAAYDGLKSGTGEQGEVELNAKLAEMLEAWLCNG